MSRKLYILTTALCALLLLALCTRSFADYADFYREILAPSASSNTLWRDMRQHFQLPNATEDYAVKRQIRWLQHHRGYLYRLMVHAAPYLQYVYQETRKRHLPAELALLPFVESEYQPFAYSKFGALGLWQMMPGTASGFGLKINWWYDGRRDLVDATNTALNYIHYLENFFDHDWLLAIAAYDAGEGTVRRAYLRNQNEHRSSEFWSLKLPYETRQYIPKLLALKAVISHPHRYHIQLPPLSRKPYLTIVNLPSQIDLREAAKLAELSPRMLRVFNPGYRRWATDPNGPHRLILPVTHIEAFQKNLAELPRDKWVTWWHHQVKQKETLSKIARRYHTEVSTLMEVNQLTSSRVHTGERLRIPREFHGTLTNLITKKRVKITGDRLPGPKRYLHTVKHGDTLHKISRLYNVKAREIRFWNNLVPRHKFEAGEKLVIWTKTHKHFSSSAAIKTIKVKSGDSLSRIAKRYHVSIKALKSANHLKTHLIRPGQMLRLS